MAAPNPSPIKWERRGPRPEVVGGEGLDTNANIRTGPPLPVIASFGSCGWRCPVRERNGLVYWQDNPCSRWPPEHVYPSASNKGETSHHRRTRVRDGSHLLGLTLEGENNSAADPVGFESCEKVQSVVIPVSPEAKTGTQTSLFFGAFRVPDICCANSGMTTQRGGY